MHSGHQPTSLGITRVLAISLMAGLSIMTGAIYFAASSMQAPTPDPNLKTILLAVVGVLALMSVAVPRPILRGSMVKQASARWASRADQDGGVREIVRSFAAYTILSLAMTESWGLVGAAAFMLTRDPAMLAIPGASLLFLAAKFPTDGRWRDFFRDATGEESPAYVQ